VTVLLFQIVFAAEITAQGGASESVSMRRSTGQILVYVRDPLGRPLTTSASVRLYSSDGTPLGQVVASNGGQATFLNVQLGDYRVEVEASGYAKTSAEAQLPFLGEARVDIYLRPESATNSSALPAGSVTVLVPKAKKELDTGIEALQTGNLKEAQRHLEKAGQLAPTNADVLYLLGTLYVQMKDLPRAEGVLERATGLDEKHARAQAALGIVLTNENKFDAAVAPLEKALDLSKQSWEARWALARCHYHLRDFRSALEQSRSALHDSNGKAPEIVLVVAASLSAMGSYEESASLLREFLQQHADRPEATRARRWLDRLKQAGKIKQD
jgi:Flp pilus assembly protein TadD